jgi:hypothetical protein
MASNESSSLCNLTLEEGDLKKLDELDPFQTDGYQTLAKIPLTVSIVYTSETGKETRDVQPIALQLLTRWMKPQPGKGKEVKGDPHLDSLKAYLSSEEDIFLSMVSKYPSPHAVSAPPPSKPSRPKTNSTSTSATSPTASPACCATAERPRGRTRPNCS